MRAPAASFGGALGIEMMSSGARQASGESIAVPKPTRYNVDVESRLSESPPSGGLLGSQPPTFFKLPSKYYALVGRSAVQDAGIDGNTVGASGPSMDVTAGPARGAGLRRVASEALFRIGTPAGVRPTGRPSNVLTGVDVTPHYDAYASVLPGASSHDILSHFSQQSAVLAQCAAAAPSQPQQQQQQQQTPSAGNRVPAAATLATAPPDVAQNSQPAAAAAQHSSLLSRGASLLSFFSSNSSSPSTSPSPSPVTSPRPPVDSAVAQPSAPAAAAAAAGAPGKLFFSRISSPELLSTFSAKPKAAAGRRRKGRGVNAKDLNALTPMDM